MMTLYMAIETWCILAIGLFFDLYSLVLVTVTAWKGKASSSAPVVGAIFYLLFALVRKAVRLDAHWALVVILIALHLALHLVLAPLLILKRPGHRH